MMEKHQDPTRPKRCAIYTRKSSEAGLEQSFNSLHAQREACEAYIKSQAHEGWKLRPSQYDDGGLSGGTMDRPALQQLIHDIQSDLIDVVVVYKVDRLSRSLADFARMVELFEQNNVSFVSVTQHFNTSSSMGRLTLNVLLSFAQFEREVTGERIRDKIAASKKKGMWMGGRVPLGYDVVEKRLVPNATEAGTVQHIYQRYLELGCVRRLKEELDQEGYVSKHQNNGEGGRPFSRGALYNLLRNPVYFGKVRHRNKAYAGQHKAILEQDLWNKVQAQLRENRSRARRRSTAKAPSLLAGLLFDDNGHPMSPTHATKNQKRYRYYVSQAILKYIAGKAGTIRRVPASSLESVVIAQLKSLLRNSEQMLKGMRQQGIPSDQWTDTLARGTRLAEEWDQFNPQRKIEVLNAALEKATLGDSQLESHFSFVGVLSCVSPNTQAFGLIDKDCSTLVVRTPVTLKRCGFETRLVVTESKVNSAHADSIKAIRSALIKALKWNQELLEGKAETITELAKKQKCDPRYVTDLIKLAWLAPDLQNAIMAGSVPANLTLDRLKKQVPISWSDQETLFR